jgi:hypothetical protein
MFGKQAGEKREVAASWSIMTLLFSQGPETQGLHRPSIMRKYFDNNSFIRELTVLHEDGERTLVKYFEVGTGVRTQVGNGVPAYWFATKEPFITLNTSLQKNRAGALTPIETEREAGQDSP